MKLQKQFFSFKSICISALILFICIFLFFVVVAKSKDEQSENIYQSTKDVVETSDTDINTNPEIDYQIVTESYKVIDTDLGCSMIIEYPKISGLNNKVLENVINKRMEVKAFSRFFSLSNFEDTDITVTYNIEYMSKDFISIKYNYQHFRLYQAYPHIEVETLNIKLDEDRVVYLSDLIKIDEKFVNNFFDNFELQNSDNLYNQRTVNSFNRDVEKYDLNGEIWDIDQYFQDKWYISDNKIVLIFSNSDGGMDHIFYESKNIDAVDLLNNVDYNN